MIFSPYQRLFYDWRIAQLWSFLVALEQSQLHFFKDSSQLRAQI
jgi:hypothetical protein